MGTLFSIGSIGNGFGPILGSALYAFAIDLVYSKHIEQENPGDATKKLDFSSDRKIIPIDGRIVFILSGLMCFGLSFYVKKYIQIDW
jgi:hypothetical protein